MKKTLLISTCLFCLTAIQLAFAQDYRSIFLEKYNISKDSATAYCNQLIASRKVNIKAFGYAAKGYLSSLEADHVQAQENFELSFNELGNISNEKAKLEERLYVLDYYSAFQLAIHNIENAINTINEGKQLSFELGNTSMLIKFENRLGRTYSILELDQKAIDNGKNSIAQIKSLKHKFSQSGYNDILFFAYLNVLNRNLNAFWRDPTNNKAYLDTIKIYKKQVRDFIATNKMELNLSQKRRLVVLDADILFITQDYKKAIEKYTETLRISQELGLNKRIYQTKYRIAECYFFLEDYENAKTLFDELDKSTIDAYKLLKNSIQIKFYYAMIYKEYGDADIALKYSDTFNAQLEDYYKEMSNLRISTFTQNELRAKKEAIENLREDLSSQKTTNSKLSSYLLFSIALIIIGVIAAIIFSKRQKSRYKQKINNLNDYIENLKRKGNVPNTNKITEDKANTILSKLRDIESQQLFTDKDYSLNKVAKTIGSNSAYVSQVVNKYWNMSFVQYTNELRINYILLKLNEDDIYQKFTLLAIAESAGYKSLISFNKHFKGVTGVTPKQYLKHLKTSSIDKKTV